MSDEGKSGREERERGRAEMQDRRQKQQQDFQQTMAADHRKFQARCSALQAAATWLDKGSEKDLLSLAQRLSVWIQQFD